MAKSPSFAHVLVLALCGALFAAHALNVTYDSRAIKIDGQRKLLIAGCIHYARSTPAMWPSLLSKAKAGGLDVVQTYVFWNAHEPVRGQFDFNGRKDLFTFLKRCQEHGLYVTLRIGPYACAEISLGGFPEWLREIPGMVFRTDNEPFKIEMQRIVKYLVDELHKRELFADQGGPVILTQIENEYGNVEAGFGDAGKRYAQWAAQFALGLEQVKVPWIMCQQWDAPDPIIETCNGFYCDGYSPKAGTPKMWTENWPGWFQAWGSPFARRPAEDVSFAMARFFARGGAYGCYYMYHGGTNFERSAASNLVTSYDYDVHLDEYGLEHEPKYSHLAALHKVLHDYEDVIIEVEEPATQSLGYFLEAHAFSKDGKCLTFLSNINNDAKSVKYNGKTFELPGWSVSLIDGCTDMKVIYNTAIVSSPTHLYSMEVRVNGVNELLLADAEESIAFVGYTLEPTVSKNDRRDFIKAASPLEMINFTHDTSDWAWYSTQVTGPLKSMSLCLDFVYDTVGVFVNGKFAGFDRKSNPCFTVDSSDEQVELRLLVSVMGLPNYGTYYERFQKGILGDVKLNGKSIKDNTWVHFSGLVGESDQYFTEAGASKVSWNPSLDQATHTPATWHKLAFNTPSGDEPVALDLSSMGKGMAWVNGHGLGRYWNLTAEGTCKPCYNGGSFSPDRCQTGCEQPSQRFYHVPRDWMFEDKPNTLVLFDEIGGNPANIKVVERELGQVCADVLENYPSETSTIVIQCTGDKKISNVDFASFGTAFGRCGTFEQGSCHAANSTEILNAKCLGLNRCEVQAAISLFGDPCPNTTKSLTVQVRCQ